MCVLTKIATSLIKLKRNHKIIIQVSCISHTFGRKNKEEKNKITYFQKVVNNSPKHVQPYLKLARLDKPVGTWLVFWPGAWGLALASPAGTFPDVSLLAIFAAGSVIMRIVACTLNDIVDKDIDQRVERTRNRPLANGDLNLTQALLFLSSQLSLALLLLIQLNQFTIGLGFASVALSLAYPYFKRYCVPQVALGVIINWSMLMAYSAVNGYLDCNVLPLYFAGICWSIFYDTIYSHQDKDDDLAIGVKSTAIAFHERTKLWLSGIATIMVSSLALNGEIFELSWPYYYSMGLITWHLVNQIYSLDIRNKEDCAKKHRSNNHIGWIGFIGLLLGNFYKEKNKTEIKVINN